jgi:cysteinyl-tRNA synthetase, unknown class
LETVLVTIIAVAGLALALLRQWKGSGGASEARDWPLGGPAPDPQPETEAKPMARPRKPKRAAASEPPAPAQEAPQGSLGRTATGTGLLDDVRTWGYQLQKVKPKDIAASPFDLMVIDYSRDGSDGQAFSPGDIQRMKVKPDGSRRQVIAYMSIGEAETYRYYWDPAWSSKKPTWLLDENPDWKENYAVCYWDAGWQATFCGNPSAYLDKIIAAGFDGVYLDKCDVFEDLRERSKSVASSRKDLEGDMVNFIVQLAQYAKLRKPPFVIIMQNAEVLLDHTALRQAIDGVAKESLLFGLPGPEKPNPKDEVDFARSKLDLARQAGKTVFVVEYLNDAAKIRDATAKLDGFGYISTISPKNRDLAQLNPDPATG